MMMKVSKSW